MFSTWIGMVLLFAFFGLLALVILRASPRGDSYEEKEAKGRVEKLVAAHEQDMQGAHDVCLGRQEQGRGANPDRRGDAIDSG